MAAVTICSDFGAQENKIHHSFPIYLPWNDGTGCRDLSVLNVEFKASFFAASFTFIKRLFSFSSFFTIRVVSSAYQRFLIFLPATLIPACVSSSSAFHVMYSAYKLNKQGDNIQPWHTPFLILNQSIVPCLVSNYCFMTCKQISQETGKLVGYSHLFKNFPVCCDSHSQRLWHSQ